MNIQQWRASGAFFSFDNQSIFYKDSSANNSNNIKQTILLLHGFPTSSWDWMKVWKELSQNYRLITLDFLGFGFSDKPLKKYTIDEQVNICQALLAKFNISNYHIIAHDYGDTVAQELLARDLDGQYTLSCTFANGGLFPEAHHSLPIQTILMSPIGRIFSWFNSQRKLKHNFDRVSFIPFSDNEITSYWQLICHNRGNRVIHKIVRYIRERVKNRERWVDALINTTVPLHLINGVLDPVSGEHMVMRYQEIIPMPNITRLHQVGHFPQIESPNKFAKACMLFIENYSKPIT